LPTPGLKAIVPAMNLREARGERLSGLRLKLCERNLIMGVLNVTPDSFSDGGVYLERDAAVERARQMIREGADLIDVGGESSRPEADPVSAADQMNRVLPVIEAIRAESEVPISVDTRSEEVARSALERGADIVNDISACRDSSGMGELVRETGAGVVLMHMRGSPKTMQQDTGYDDLVGEVLEFLAERVEFARSIGIPDESIWIDPGIGFGKPAEGNLEILRNIREFDRFGLPVVVGVSRKSFIGKILGREVGSRLSGTLAVTAYLADGKTHRVHRVHDVADARDALRMVEAIHEVC